MVDHVESYLCGHLVKFGCSYRAGVCWGSQNSGIAESNGTSMWVKLLRVVESGRDPSGTYDFLLVTP